MNGLAETPMLIAAFILLILWSTVWKGIAMWKAARLSHKGWFIALIIFNTAGILEIVYVFGVARKAERMRTLAGPSMRGGV